MCIRDSFKGSFLASIILSFTIKVHKFLPTFDSFVDKYIVINLFTKDLLLKFGIQNNRIFYKSNYLPSSTIVETIKKDYYLFAGRLSYEKGISNLLSTFNANKKPLIIAGEGELREYVLCNKLDNIKYVGLKSKESILSLMHEAKALIFPSIWIESMPMTIIESLSLGTIPIIAKSINTETMIENGINGILYDSNDNNGLNKALDFFESLSIEQTNLMSQMAIEKFNHMYSETTHLEKIKDIYFN
jgi:glycosyltransferase involved in cell wall biosynthesis